MELEPTADGCFNDAFEMPQVGQEPLKPCSSDANPPPPAGCFDCNICLDYATDPVVTLCGHLYCWPCIYHWLQVDTTSPQCPVCKASLSENTLVPLYGRGHTSAAKGSQRTLKTPKRPSAQAQRDAHRIEDLYTYRPPSMQWQRQHHHNHHHHHHHYYPYYNSHMPSGQPLPTRALHSTAGGALGGIAALLLPWAFRNPQGTSMYYSSPYHFMTGGNNPRLRRHEMQIERSLHQIWVFLLCCALLCLLLF